MDGASILLIVISVFIGGLGAHFFHERINSQKIKDSDDKARMIVESMYSPMMIEKATAKRRM